MASNFSLRTLLVLLVHIFGSLARLNLTWQSKTEVQANVYGLVLFLNDTSLTLQGEGIHQYFFNTACNIVLQL